MTFVLSALTHHEVLQVSDRRFTYTQPGRKVTYDDEQNKAVLFCGRILFSFTGVGDLGMERQTDLWLAQRICDVIAEHDPGDQYSVLRGVADKATTLFQEKLRYRGRRHAFIGVGWGRFGEQATDAPGKPDEFRPLSIHQGCRPLREPALAWRQYSFVRLPSESLDSLGHAHQMSGKGLSVTAVRGKRHWVP